jgi:hypothetical protein
VQFNLPRGYLDRPNDEPNIPQWSNFFKAEFVRIRNDW